MWFSLLDLVTCGHITRMYVFCSYDGMQRDMLIFPHVLLKEHDVMGPSYAQMIFHIFKFDFSWASEVGSKETDEKADEVLK